MPISNAINKKIFLMDSKANKKLKNQTTTASITISINISMFRQKLKWEKFLFFLISFIHTIFCTDSKNSTISNARIVEEAETLSRWQEFSLWWKNLWCDVKCWFKRMKCDNLKCVELENNTVQKK